MTQELQDDLRELQLKEEFAAADVCRNIGINYRELARIEKDMAEVKERMDASKDGARLKSLKEDRKAAKERLATAMGKAARQGELFEAEEKGGAGERAEAVEQVA